MASGVNAVGSGSAGTSGHKAGGQSSGLAGCLPFSQHRQTSGQYPDIVDNENCFQPVNSDSCNDLTRSGSNAAAAVLRSGQGMASAPVSRHQGSRPQPEPQPPGGSPHPLQYSDSGRMIPGSGTEHGRVPGGGSGEYMYPPYPDPSQLGSPPMPLPSTSRGPQLPTYHQIQTRDASIGVTAHMDPPPLNILPDILHSTHVMQQMATPRAPNHRQGRGERRGRSGDHHGRGNRHRNRDGTTRTGRHGHRTRTRSSSSTQAEESRTCKEPCVNCVVRMTSFRWVLVVLSLLGVCCVVTGIVLAALHAAGNSFLFLAIMFIGLGVLLVIVVGVGWKCTPRGHEPLHALFGIGDFRRRGGSGGRRQHRAYRTRDSNWYGGVMYPEFQYRRPPPSYAASMQEYQQQLALQHQYLQAAASSPPPHPDNLSLPSSPPPSYRSRTSTIHSGIHGTFSGDDQPNSRPPTYRSHVGTTGRRHSRPPIPRGDSGDSEGVDPALDPSHIGDVSFAGPDTRGGQDNLGFNAGAPGGPSSSGMMASRSEGPGHREPLTSVVVASSSSASSGGVHVRAIYTGPASERGDAGQRLYVTSVTSSSPNSVENQGPDHGVPSSSEGAGTPSSVMAVSGSSSASGAVSRIVASPSGSSSTTVGSSHHALLSRSGSDPMSPNSVSSTGSMATAASPSSDSQMEGGSSYSTAPSRATSSSPQGQGSEVTGVPTRVQADQSSQTEFLPAGHNVVVEGHSLQDEHEDQGQSSAVDRREGAAEGASRAASLPAGQRSPGTSATAEDGVQKPGSAEPKDGAGGVPDRFETSL